MSSIRLLICDVDGTLVTSEKELTAAVIDAAKRLRARGIELALTSGRPPRGMKMLLGPLALQSPLACFNGGAFVRPDLTLLEVRAIKPETAARVFELLRENGADIWVYTEDTWLLRDISKPHVARELWTVKFDPTVIKNFDRVPASIVKIVGVSDDHARLAACEEEMTAKLDGAISASRSWPYYLDVTNPRANKGEVVDFYARYYGLSHESIAAIGDGNNDTLMFKKVGLGIAVDNANDFVKSFANVTVASNDAGGFVEAVDRYLLAGKRAA